MSTAKRIPNKHTPLLEAQSDLLYKIKGEALESIAQYFNRFGYYFKNDVLTFLRNPITYHGKPTQLNSIVIKHLRVVVSKYTEILQNQHIPIKSAEDRIFNQICRGKKK